jgi:hypothetical protein
MTKTQDLLTRVAMCISNHHGCFCTAAAMPFHPCGSRMLKDFHGLASMSRAGMALAPPIRQEEGWTEGFGGLATRLQLRDLPGALMCWLTGPTEPWPREKTYARTLADHALYQALPAVPRPRAERDHGGGARLEPPVLLPGACGHARVESGHGPPRLPTPACRLPSGQHPAAPRRGPSRLTSNKPDPRGAPVRLVTIHE